MKTLPPRAPHRRVALASTAPPRVPWPPLEAKKTPCDTLLLLSPFFPRCSETLAAAPEPRSGRGRRRTPPSTPAAGSRSSRTTRIAVVSSSSSSKQSDGDAVHRRVGLVLLAAVRRAAAPIPAPSVHLGLRRSSARAQGELTVPRDISPSSISMEQ